MDVDTNIPQMRHGDGALAAVRDRLKRIDPAKSDPTHVQWLWEQMVREDYASDDIGAANFEVFISNLFLPNSRHFEYEDKLYIAVLNIIARVNADVHFAMWGDVPIREVMLLHDVVADEMYNELGCNRITAYIPAFNKKMIRLATVVGYRYEGELRQIFLKNGTYHNLFVYGLLKSEWLRRKAG